MTWVKICGTTNLEDALVAVDAGADAVGFVFYEKSKRKISPAAAGEIVCKLPDRIEKVGVFVDQESGQIREIALLAGLTAVQLHGEGSMQSVWKNSRPVEETAGVSKLIPVFAGDALKDGGIFIGEAARSKMFAMMLDSRSKGATGGTGTTFDWEATRGMVQALSFSVPTIVAGGLTPENVSEAIGMLQPFGVDVVSGVEARPGKKDPEKVRAFVRAVRECDRKAS